MKKAILFIVITVVALALILSTVLWIYRSKNPPERIPKEGYYEDPPSITITCGEETLKPGWWCFGWDVEYTDGTGSSFDASYPHPLSEYAEHQSLTLAEPTVHFAFSAPPESVSVVRWPISQIGKAEDAEKEESVSHAMSDSTAGTLTAEKGYLYKITGRWKGGPVSYYFITQ